MSVYRGWYIKSMRLNERITNRLIPKSTKSKWFTSSSPLFVGTILKIFTMTPRKPNSAIRKVAYLKVKSRKGNIREIIRAYLPGINHNYTVHNKVFFIKKRIGDLPGINYKVIKGN